MIKVGDTIKLRQFGEIREAVVTKCWKNGNYNVKFADGMKWLCKAENVLTDLPKIDAINGYDIKKKKSEELAKGIEAFLKKGGKITELSNSESTAHGYSFNTDDKSPKSKNTAKKKKEEFQARLEVQMPIFQDFKKCFGTQAWLILKTRINSLTSIDQLKRTCAGTTTIKDPKRWEKVKNAMAELKREHGYE